MPCSRSPQGASPAYVNHAHNDILEVWLETGVLGLALMGLFVVWLVRRSVEIWRSAPADGANELDWSLARAATIVVGLIVAHSFFDYPLRTGAMMAIMAFACALLIEPPVGAECTDRQELEVVAKRTRHRDTRRLEPAASPALPTSITPQRSANMPQTVSKSLGSVASPGCNGGEADVEWPEEWSKSSNPGLPRRAR